MVDINDSVISSDESLKVTLTAFDSNSGKGQVKIEELVAKPGSFYVIIKFGAGSQLRIDYKTVDVHKASVFDLCSMVKHDSVAAIEIVPAGNL
jgi:hypothetical protein